MVISFRQNWLMGTGSFTVGSGTAKNRMVPPVSTQSIADMAAEVAPVQTITWSAKCPSFISLSFWGRLSLAFKAWCCAEFFGKLQPIRVNVGYNDVFNAFEFGKLSMQNS